MLSISEMKIGKIVQISEDPYMIVKADHHQCGRGGAVLKIKLKNLTNGATLEKTVQGSERLKKADTERGKANFMYLDENEANFMNNDTYEQFGIGLDQIGDKAKYLKEGTDVDVFYFNSQALTIDLPVKMEFKVVSAPPGVKGNSAGNVTKQVELENGIDISVPMFINEGDVIRVNTDTGEYVERVN